MLIRRLASIHVLSALTLIFCGTLALAQPPKAAEDVAANQDPAAEAEETAVDHPPPPDGDNDLSSPRTLLEQSIYIPYSKLRDVFEAEGRGVFLPYEQFQELWKAARASEARPPKQGPPVSAVITEIESDAVVQKEVVRVEATISIEVLSEGWTTVPLRLRDTSILSAMLNDKPARITFDKDLGYQLLLHSEKAGAAPLALTLVYAKAFDKSPGRHTVSFEAPQAPVNRWRIRVPQPGVKIDVRPLIAATEVSADSQELANEENANAKTKESVLLAFVGAAPAVEINWTPESAGASGLEALTTVTVVQDVTFDEGLVRTQAKLAYQIERAELAELVIEVPSDQKVVNVFDANVRQWEVEVQGDVQKVHVQLFEPIRGAQPLVIELEQYTAESDRREVTIPVVRAIAAARQHGTVAVHAVEGLRVEIVRRQGVLQLDTTELSAPTAMSAAHLAYRFATVPFEIIVAVEKIQPRIQVEQFVAVEVSPQHVAVDLTAVYHIEQAGVFQLQLELPPDFEILSIHGRATDSPKAEAAEVDEYVREDDGSTVVNLSRKALGDVALEVRLTRTLDDPNLSRPTGNSSEVEIPIPRVDTASVERESGWLVVHAPESLQVNPAKHENLRAIPLNEARQHWGGVAHTRFAKARRVLAFAFNERSPALTVLAERRQPHVTAALLLVVRVDVGLVHYTATLKYDVRYSGVESVRVDIPQALLGQIRNVTEGLREQVIDPPPDDLQEGYVAWQIKGDSDLLGHREVRLEWEQPIDRLDVGSSVDLQVPVLLAREVDRAWGQIVVTKSEALDVAPAQVPEGLRPIDPSHDLMPDVSIAKAAAAFEFHDRWSLTLRATHYEPQPLAQSTIERSVVRMVVTRGGQTAVQALYRLRSRRQRLTIKLPAGAQFGTQPLRVDGRTSTLEQGGTDTYFVPLVGTESGKPVVVELRYTVDGTQSQLNLPEFPDDSSVLKTYLCVHAPDELALLGFEGPWTDEMQWELTDHLDWIPRPRKSEEELVRRWLIGDLPVEGDPLESFPTDGRLYLFSALQLDAPPEGALHLATADRRGLKLAVLLVIALLGLAMLRFSVGQRLAVFALLVVACVLLGVLAPTLSRQIVDGVLVIAMGVMLLAWFAYYLLRQRPRQLATAAAAAVVAVQAVSSTAAAEVHGPRTSPPPAEASASPTTAGATESPDVASDVDDDGGENARDEQQHDDPQQGGRNDA